MSDEVPGSGGAVGTARTWRAIGTTVSVLTVDPRAALPAAERLAEHLDALDRACSRFRDDSEIARVHAACGAPVLVSSLLADLVAAAIDVARFTDGIVDPTVGSAVEAIGYDRDFASVGTSGPPLSGAPVPAPGWECVALDLSRRELTVPPGVVVDLGSSAKALAADRAAEEISGELGTGVLVNLGGDIAVAGEPPEGGWVVGLAADSTTAPESTSQAVAILSGGIASSGTSVRTWRRGDRVLHHIVDPRTGDVARSRWILVSVAAGTCLAANAASTAAVVLGDEAVDWLEHRSLPARLVAEDGAVVTVSGWPADRER
ncbi:MAG: FAD:protein FMN transferase [Actinomycetota bacterium]|nr:FAD:protein FMN transferase [Actinomycetota bacterium]